MRLCCHLVGSCLYHRSNDLVSKILLDSTDIEIAVSVVYIWHFF